MRGRESWEWGVGSRKANETAALLRTDGVRCQCRMCDVGCRMGGRASVGLARLAQQGRAREATSYVGARAGAVEPAPLFIIEISRLRGTRRRKTPNNRRAAVCKSMVAERKSMVAVCKSMVAERRSIIAACKSMVRERRSSIAVCKSSVAERKSRVEACPSSVAERESTAAPPHHPPALAAPHSGQTAPAARPVRS